MLKSIYCGLRVLIHTSFKGSAARMMIRWSTLCSVRKAGEYNGCTWHWFDPTRSPCWGWTWRLFWWIWSDHHAEGKQDGWVVTLVRLSSVHRLSSVKPYVQQVCGGDLGPTIFSSLVNMAVMMVTLLRLSSVYWWTLRLLWWLWSDYFQFTGEHGGCDSGMCPTIFSLLVNIAVVMVTCARQSSVYW